MNSIVRFSSIFVAISFLALPLSAVEKEHSEQLLPISRVVLYRHGLGYIEREGRVKEDAVISFYFQEKQMNDVLASFYAIDLNGGKITSVQYDTQEPVSERFKKILIRIPDKYTLSELISELKGAEITAKTADEEINGRILGVEPVEEIVSGTSVKKDVRLVALTDSGAVKTVNLSAVHELKIKNEELKKDLNKLLDISLESKYANLKKVTLKAEGKGERTIRIGYLVGMPVWKCSYRVIFDSKDKDKALIQGWALAENNTDDDWKSVDMSFVAGNPLSFIMNLYAPLYINRQTIPVPGLQSLDIDWGSAPKNQIALKRTAPAPAAMQLASAAPSAGKMAESFESAAMFRDEAASGAQIQDYIRNSMPQASFAKSLDALFSYTVNEKVSIEQGKAAMIPILLSSIESRKIIYFKESFSLNAMNAVVLRNSTGLTLDAGPVAFYENNTSLGEGVLGKTFTPDNSEILPYAVAAGVSVTPEISYDRSKHFKGKLANGVLTLTCTEIITSKWVIENKGSEDETLWIQKPVNSSYTLIEPEKPLDKSEGDYIFEIPLKAGEKKDFAVKEKRDIDETVYISGRDDKTIAFYASAPYLDAKTRALLSDISKLAAQKAELERGIRQNKTQIAQLAEKQNRIRQNLSILMNSSNAKEQSLRSKWIDALSSSESDIENLNQQINSASAEIESINKKILTMLNNFDSIPVAK